jgi:hypothetical protein
VVRGVLNDLPDWGLLAIVCVGLPAMSVGAFFVVDRRLGSWRTDASSAVVVAVGAMVMTLFALVLAFAAVNLYDGYRSAAGNVDEEANTLTQIMRDVRVFPAADRDRVDRALVDYIDVVTKVEFPAMRVGDSAKSHAALPLADRLFASVQRYEPKTARQQAFYGSVVGELNDLAGVRRDRIAAADSSLPRAFTVLLLITAAVSIVMTFFLRTHTIGLDIAMVSGVSLVVGAGLLTVALLEYPFSGSVSIASDPFTHGTLANLLAGGH